MNVRTAIAIVVTLVWATTYLAAVFSKNFHPDLAVNAVMLMVAGFFFSSGIRRPGRNGNDTNPK